METAEKVKKSVPRYPPDTTDRRLDLAARAAWLSYEKHRTQDQIAKEMQVSRQVVQRLMALAHRSGLIEFRLNHVLKDCIELAEALRDRYGLRYCDVAPNESETIEDMATVGSLGARYLETILPPNESFTLGVGNGRTMRELSRRLDRRELPNCRCVSLMGNLTRDGKANNHDVVTWVAEALGAQCYPRPMPIITNTAEECRVLQAQPGYLSISGLIAEAGVLIMGMGFFGARCSLLEDGFITEAEARQAIAAGAVGEMLGFAIDQDGQFVDAEYHDRLTSYRQEPNQERPVVIVASGLQRAAAIIAACNGRLVNGLITDENTARILLDEERSKKGNR
ncbi:sugar-binding transcriptional regulator [Jiella sonneratiae]|uniref:Sugar-binding transcriptional regulator n=1 Tax=Jiella sonneratiae TaxID=2816856 RepID=A0ABS3J3I3_9HYPH|nr:sugar-binding domain-containing protein [Jiella sonneratiae]MBO0904227.1 sugar-binding transcriptional regulator [Jiella sonneratiae]